MARSTLLDHTTSSMTWLATISVLVVVFAATIVYQLARRPSVPRHAPALRSGWPLVGCLDFFRTRADFLISGCEQSPGRHFSFHFGIHSIIALSGADARRSFFATRGLDPMAGYSALLTGFPSTYHLEGGEIDSRHIKTLKLLMTKPRMVANLNRLISDADTALRKLDILCPLDPFDSIYRLVYQMTHRLIGSYDVANSPRQLAETLSVYRCMNDSSATQIMFPMLPTMGKLRKIWAGAKLHFVFRSMMKDRRMTGRREDDAVQIMMDKGDSDIQISTFIIAGLFAGLLNSGVNAAWVLCYLARHRHWYMKIKTEVDQIVTAHRQSENETPTEILQRLSIDQWETIFPLIGLALQESIRLNLPGVFIRKNITNRDLPISGTDRIIPRGAYAVYLADDTHLDSDLYPDPLEWNPDRHIQRPIGFETGSPAYLGWGEGLHPCLGKRFAKLEVSISTAMFMSYYEFELCDGNGQPWQGTLPMTDRNWHGAKPIMGQVYFKLTPRYP